MLADFLDKCGHILILDNSLRASFFAHSSWPRHGWGKEESPPGPPARPPAYPSHCHIRCASVVRRSGVAAEERAEGSNRLSSASVAVSFLRGPSPTEAAVVSP